MHKPEKWPCYERWHSPLKVGWSRFQPDLSQLFNTTDVRHAWTDLQDFIVNIWLLILIIRLFVLIITLTCSGNMTSPLVSRVSADTILSTKQAFSIIKCKCLVFEYSKQTALIIRYQLPLITQSAQGWLASVVLTTHVYHCMAWALNTLSHLYTDERFFLDHNITVKFDSQQITLTPSFLAFSWNLLFKFYVGIQLQRVSCFKFIWSECVYFVNVRSFQ